MCTGLPSFETIQVRVEGDVATIVLNRPERLNALSMHLLDELSDALDFLAGTAARVVVLRGAGRAFSAGYDIASDSEEVGEAQRRGSVADRNRQTAYIERFTKIWRHPVPVIAAIHGFCMAGATQMVCFCDLTIVADDAVIAASPTIPLGGGFISPLWAYRIGPNRAKEMSFIAGRQISGRTAAEWGWANEAVPAGELDDRVAEVARQIAKTPAPILQMKKVAINRVQEMQGFLVVAGMGADTDALIHTTDEVAAAQELVRSLGLKAAVAAFRD